jgi:hypothetical protein
MSATRQRGVDSASASFASRGILQNTGTVNRPTSCIFLPMAIVRRLEQLALETAAAHTETVCTYAVIRDSDGKQYLQIDTYGSAERKISGKKSQSMRFAPEAIKQLREILEQF